METGKIMAKQKKNKNIEVRPMLQFWIETALSLVQAHDHTGLRTVLARNRGDG